MKARLAFISPWNGLIIGHAGFLSADLLFFFCMVLQLFRSVFILSFQVSQCLYFSYHSFFPSLFLSQMSHCTFSGHFLTTEFFFSRILSQRHGCAISELGLPSQTAELPGVYFGIMASETRMSTKEDYQIGKALKIFPCQRK